MVYEGKQHEYKEHISKNLHVNNFKQDFSWSLSLTLLFVIDLNTRSHPSIIISTTIHFLIILTRIEGLIRCLTACKSDPGG